MKFKRWLGVAVCVAVLCSVGSKAFAHCQVPCGIYNDPVRFTMLEEHVTTIEKSMKLITELSAEETKNYNQIVRWVNNKETHANEFTEIVTYYFLAQRITADKENYTDQLKAAHAVIVAAMKCKQSADPATAEALQKAVFGLYEAYTGKKPQLHEH
jgi:nickel superoxide dismutase